MATVGRQRYTFVNADVTVEADPSNVTTTGGSGGGGGSDTVTLDDGQFTDIMFGLGAITQQISLSESAIGKLLSNLQLPQSSVVAIEAVQFSSLTDQLSVCIMALEAIDTKLETIVNAQGGLASSVVQIETGQYDGLTLGLELIEAAIYATYRHSQSGGGGAIGPYVALNPVQFSALLAAIGSAKTSPPPKVYPPKPPPTPQWLDILGQVNSGTLLSPKGAIGSLAGGKVGMAVQMAETITDTIVKPFQFARSAIQQLGEAAVKVAKNDGFGLVTQGIDAASDALGKIPIVGKAFAAGLDLASTGLKVFKGTLDALASRGRELGQYNPEIAMAAAVADVRKIFADINEANRMSSRYADLIAKQQQIDERFQRALLPLKEAIADLTIKLAPLIEKMIEDFAEFIGTFSDKMDLFGTLINPMNGVNTKLDAIAKYQEAMARYAKKREDEMDKQMSVADDFWRNIEKSVANLPMRGGQFDPVDVDADNGLRIPLR